MSPSLRFSEEVKKAISDRSAIVALESTIITHGMPYPQNIETAQSVEEIVRANGATPATIAILDGEICIGLEPVQLSKLAQAKDVHKVSRADFAVTMAQGATGSTTVAATMIAARLAGISVFATGGIGGVHRGAEASFDISADLLELAQTQVSVVAAGPKAILDLPKTLEVLETQGVPVITYGQNNLPAFWSKDSGIASPLRSDTLNEIAKSHVLRGELGIPGGQLVNNPIPAADEIPASELAPHIAQALQEAEDQAIDAKDVTPFLLQRIFELTEGRSLVANIALVKNNAKVASHLAVEISNLT